MLSYHPVLLFSVGLSHINTKRKKAERKQKKLLCAILMRSARVQVEGFMSNQGSPGNRKFLLSCRSRGCDRVSFSSSAGPSILWRTFFLHFQRLTSHLPIQLHYLRLITAKHQWTAQTPRAISLLQPSCPSSPPSARSVQLSVTFCVMRRLILPSPAFFRLAAATRCTRGHVVLTSAVTPGQPPFAKTVSDTWFLAHQKRPPSDFVVVSSDNTFACTFFREHMLLISRSARPRYPTTLQC